jgi:enoyl-CoA hydratase
MSTETIVVETKGRVGIIRLNRPQVLNALNKALVAELNAAVAAFDADINIGCILITGSEKAFAAGADIKEMADKTHIDAFLNNFGANEDGIARARKPVVAAVAGFALGGGCEFAMQADVIVAADNARFGQPEIKLGVIPGYGGTQRLTHAIGKAKAMDMILTARMMDAPEAERTSLVSRVVPLADLIPTALEAASKIAALSPNAVKLTKEMVNAAYETPLSQGVKLERRLFHSLFAFDDQKEGMAAFIEKRPAKFTRR